MNQIIITHILSDAIKTDSTKNAIYAAKNFIHYKNWRTIYAKTLIQNEYMQKKKKQKKNPEQTFNFLH